MLILYGEDTEEGEAPRNVVDYANAQPDDLLPRGVDVRRDVVAFSESQ